MASYKLSKQAAKDLKSIYKKSHTDFGKTQAESYTLDLGGRFSLLTSFPGMGLPADISTKSYFKFPSGSHVIYYMKTDYGILIGRILHSAQLPSKQF
ncbi:MAG: type II toxin-antitoxin system RelE/ParE family toxin, partial [Pseudomonadota bacterium]